MSRCFPYPPPSYVKNGICDEALIESIKKEVEKAKKEKRRQRKYEKKVRERTKKNGEVEIKKHCKKRQRDGRSSGDQQRGDKENTRQIEVGHLERSVVTEEHGHPVGSQISTDSTYNINKRLKLQNPSVDGEVHNPGSIIRIKLSAQMHKDSDVLPKEQPCSSCKRMQYESVPRPSIDMAELCCSTSAIVSDGLSFRPIQPKSCPTSAVDEATLLNGLAGESLALAAELKDLVENLLTPPLPEEWTIPDLGWLFETKQSKNGATERCSISIERKFPRLDSSNPWPCAQFLPDADVYALPYSIPF